MSNLHLVTGYAGKAHVTAADHGSFFEAIIRSGQFVTNAGSKFAASIISNNQIRISDGELIMQGRHVKLDPGAYIDVTVENGTQGYSRNDLIVARYLKNADSGIETVDFVVVKGTPVTNDPSDPTCVSGDINGGNAMQHDMPMYRVPLTGLNVGALVPLFAVHGPLSEDVPAHTHSVSDLNDETDTLKKLLETGYLVLNEKQYGHSFPSDAPDGTLFFIPLEAVSS